MSYVTVLADIKTVLEGVTGIGNVFDYIRTEENIQGAKDVTKHVASSKFHVWFITRQNFSSEAQGNGLVFRNHEFRLLGFYGISDTDASEKVFQELCDTICTEFDMTANIAFDDCHLQILACELIEFTPKVVAFSTRCHMAEIAIHVTEDANP